MVQASKYGLLIELIESFHQLGPDIDINTCAASKEIISWKGEGIFLSTEKCDTNKVENVHHR